MAAKTWQEQLAKMFPDIPEYQKVKELKEVQQDAVENWDSKPFVFLINGVSTEFFSIGQLGKALGNRSPNTLRAWERTGIIPKSRYTKPSTDPRGRRRMYTRAMVEGMMKIAREEGVLWPHKGLKLSETQFTPRVKELFLRLQTPQ